MKEKPLHPADLIDKIATQCMPPRAFMQQIMDKTSKLYCFLWDKKDEEGSMFLGWHEVVYLYQKNSFRSCMRKLKEQNLLTYRETDSGVKIKLFEWGG